MAVANTLAYYDTVTITVVKSFIVQTPDRLLKIEAEKTFTAIIDNTLQ